MSDNLIAPAEFPIELPAEFPVERRGLRERGMATVEYALGVVVVIVIIGAIVVAIQTGSFGTLLEGLIQALMGWITGAFDLELLDFFRK